MGDHLVLYVDHLIAPPTLEYMQQEETEAEAEVPQSSSSSYSSSRGGGGGEGGSHQSHGIHDGGVLHPSGSSTSCRSPGNDRGVQEHAVVFDGEEKEPLIIQKDTVECRICQEEDQINNLETPCACRGSLKFAHRECVQRWCNEKGDITCEICHQQYKPNYTAPPSQAHSSDTTIDISGGWTISGSPLSLHDHRLFVMAATERHLLEAEYEDYAETNASGAAFCRSAALVLMALLLLRHALMITNSDGDDDATTAFSLFLLRIGGFLLPCYIMAWAISVLQRRRQRQEAAALAATEVAFVLQSGQRRGLQFTIAPGPGVVAAHQLEALQ